MKTTFCWLMGLAAAALSLAVLAQAPVEISFYYPVAVGGPITKIIDGYAAEFQSENPTIKVTPIYSGTYQDTLTKAQTALKAGAGPQLAVLLSTDVFSLIDDDLCMRRLGVLGGVGERLGDYVVRRHLHQRFAVL